MNPQLASFAARLREIISAPHPAFRAPQFNELALELFALQFSHNAAYRKICEGRNLTPEMISDWTQIPAVPTGVFKDLELTSIPPAERTAVFHSSGTTEQKPSRHFHCPESLALYEASLWAWFRANFQYTICDFRFICLTPPPAQAPHSSLVHMFETIRQKTVGTGVPASRSPFFSQVDKDGVWTLDYSAVVEALNASLATRPPSLILGTAFSFVHLLDFLTEKDLKLALPPGSQVMETGGYKNRSRTMPKAELHALITERLGVPRENIFCEYGMSELSSQAYDVAGDEWRKARDAAPRHPSPVARHFHFPPWARVQIISPETGREVADGETGLIRIFDLANVFSVAAIQTEDLAIRRGDGFELIGRAQLAEPRGCSLMTA
jgi:hypothetical protein